MRTHELNQLERELGTHFIKWSVWAPEIAGYLRAGQLTQEEVREELDELTADEWNALLDLAGIEHENE